VSSPIPVDTIATLIDTWRAVSELGATFTEEQWKAPSGLPGWTVQDVLSHLIGTERMLQGLPTGPPRAVGGEAHVRNPIADFNENEVAARRDRPGGDVLAEWDDLCARREHTLTTADEAYFAQPMVLPTGPGTMGEFLSLRVLDCWVHEQDIRRAVGRPGGYDRPAAGHTIDRLIRTIPIVVGKRAACPEGRAVRIVITGPIERDLTCEVNGGRAAFVAAPAEPPLATVTFDAETFVALANGRSGPSGGRAAVIEADTEAGRGLGQRVVEGLNMMI
jgi:uncharacterized protein (TIGR03083 family)